MGNITVVVGGQFGSEAKGHVTAALAERKRGTKPWYVRVAGPNAGHTAYDQQGRAWALRQIPVAGVVDTEAPLALGPGSEIDEQVLAQEVNELEAAGIPVKQRLFIDAQATVITDTDKRREAVMFHGSTQKGIGAARASRLMREAPLWGHDSDEYHPTQQTDVAGLLQLSLEHNRDVIIEGTQGYGLGLHAGYYPHCTSSDCRAVDFLAMSGLSPWAPYVESLDVWIVFRTFPIRIAGNSGPMYGETTWEALAEETGGYIKPERTTVTKKIRRVGYWDPMLARAAVRANGGPGPRVHGALMFMDYIDPEIAGATLWSELTKDCLRFIERVEDDCGIEIQMVGTGPNSRIFKGE